MPIYAFSTTYPSEQEEESHEPEDESEVTLEKVEEEMQEMYDDNDEEDEENIMHLDDLTDFTQHMVSMCDFALSLESEQIYKCEQILKDCISIRYSKECTSTITTVYY